MLLLSHRAILAKQRTESPVVDQTKVAAVFQKYCSSCHNDNEPEADISLSSLEKVLSEKSTEDKPLILPGDADASLLLQLISGKARPQMPPAEEPQPSAEDIALIRSWIAAGAKITHSPSARSVPKPSSSTVKTAMIASACFIDAQRLALGRVGKIDIVGLDGQQNIATIDGILGKVTSLRTSADGKLLVVGSGNVGVEGQISIVELSSLKVVRQLSGHNDLVYCAAISPDGQWLASGSYDRKVVIWNVKSAEPAVVITGHNGPIYDLDFHPQGQMLATASGDQTIKLWKIPDGSRLDTLGQPEGEMRCVRFAADGKLLYGGGADRQIRQWLVDPAASTGSPMLLARFAHERELLRMEVDGRKVITASADGKVKLWTAQGLLPLGEIATTTSLPVAVCMAGTTNPIVADLKGGLQAISAEAIDKLLSSAGMNGNSQVTSSDSSSMPKFVANSAPSEIIKITEAEPNNDIEQAQVIQLPAEISGVLQATDASSADQESDLFKFFARAGEAWAIELFAASEKSSLDSKIDILDSQGQPVLRTRLQALRESYFTFRGKDSSTSDDFRMHKWQDMELDEYLYSGGEVTRLWLYPRGPDSGFKVYPGAGARHTFFGTTPISHPLGEPAYIVRPLRDDETPLPNGLPVFPIYFENDDDPLRERGSDSRLTFLAPADGQYILRIRDARGFAGSENRYRAVIRSLQPDFTLNVANLELKVPNSSGLEWSVKVNRNDALDSAIAISLHGLPDGILATNPLVIEANQLAALGTIYVGPDIKPTTEPIEIRLTAKTIPTDGSKPIEKELAERIKLSVIDSTAPRIVLLPQATEGGRAGSDQELGELTIQPGQTISARLRVERNGVEGGISFGKDDSGRNLPHGAFVDNIGLNGLLIVDGQTEREFFITAAPKLKPGRYQFHFRSEIKGNPTSKPIWLNVIP